MVSEFEGVVVEGAFDEKFTATVSQFASHIKTGLDVGASFALSVDGEMVVLSFGCGSDGQLGHGGTEDQLQHCTIDVSSLHHHCAIPAAFVRMSIGRVSLRHSWGVMWSKSLPAPHTAFF